jgi:hypothetical protein
MTSDDAGPSYLEHADTYEYNTLVIGRMIAHVMIHMAKIQTLIFFLYSLSTFPLPFSIVT